MPLGRARSIACWLGGATFFRRFLWLPSSAAQGRPALFLALRSGAGVFVLWYASLSCRFLFGSLRPLGAWILPQFAVLVFAFLCLWGLLSRCGDGWLAPAFRPLWVPALPPGVLPKSVVLLPGPPRGRAVLALLPLALYSLPLAALACPFSPPLALLLSVGLRRGLALSLPAALAMCRRGARARCVARGALPFRRRPLSFLFPGSHVRWPVVAILSRCPLARPCWLFFFPCARPARSRSSRLTCPPVRCLAFRCSRFRPRLHFPHRLDFLPTFPPPPRGDLPALSLRRASASVGRWLPTMRRPCPALWASVNLSLPPWLRRPRSPFVRHFFVLPPPLAPPLSAIFPPFTNFSPVFYRLGYPAATALLPPVDLAAPCMAFVHSFVCCDRLTALLVAIFLAPPSDFASASAPRPFSGARLCPVSPRRLRLVCGGPYPLSPPRLVSAVPPSLYL